MRIADPYLEELTAEAPTTRRVLERVPEAHLDWRPHAKSMSLGQLALHVATLPRPLTEFVSGDALDFSSAAGAPPTVSIHQELMAAFAASTEQAQAYLGNLSDERAMATWRLATGSRELIRGTARCRAALVPVQSLVSPPGTATRLLATPRRACAIGLRTHR